MTDQAADVKADACWAAQMLALDPALGACVRGGAGPGRAAWLAAVEAMAEGPVRKLPLGIAEDRLVGGLDLVATLAAGAPRRMAGLLEEAAGGIVVVAMAERVAAAVAGRVAQALDLQATDGGGFGLVLLDEGEGEEAVAAALLDRVGLYVNADAAGTVEVVDLEEARATLPLVSVEDAAIEALCGAAVALGVWSARGPLLALRAARAAAAVSGRAVASPDDIALAARLVLAPRATRLPADQDEEQEQEQEQAPEPEAAPQDDEDRQEAGELAERVLEAAKAAIPSGLLAALASGGAARARSAGKAGTAMAGARGRRLGSRPGVPRGGARLDLVETLRTAAPWQRVRGAEPGRVAIRKDDLRILRREQRSETTTVFMVDASGSAAVNRLAEAKGAVLLLLAECYVRRDQVAVVGFRGREAAVLLPPTRSLVRARRSLAGLPGGGGTPLAAGIELGAAMADAVRRRGGTPSLVLLTDGQANVARDGAGGRARAGTEALEAARRVAAARFAALVIDTSPRPNPAARALAGAMAARYVPLPFAEARVVSAAAGRAA